MPSIPTQNAYVAMIVGEILTRVEADLPVSGLLEMGWDGVDAAGDPRPTQAYQMHQGQALVDHNPASPTMGDVFLYVGIPSALWMYDRSGWINIGAATAINEVEISVEDPYTTDPNSRVELWVARGTQPGGGPITLDDDEPRLPANFASLFRNIYDRVNWMNDKLVELLIERQAREESP